MCAGPRQLLARQFLALLPPTCRTWSPTGDIDLGIFTEGNLLLATSQPSTWSNQRGARSHQDNFWRRCGDSNLQDRGVAHYLLHLLFNLVSLLSSFCFRVFY